MFSDPLRAVISLLVLVVCGCTAPTVEGGTKQVPAASLPKTITLDYGTPVTLQIEQTNEKLSMTFTTVKDSRCPKEARCIWAGHAAVMLKVSKVGAGAGAAKGMDAPEESIVIGTTAPASMKLPFEANYAGYQFKLITLDPANSVSPSAAKLYQAKVQISILAPASK